MIANKDFETIMDLNDFVKFSVEKIISMETIEIWIRWAHLPRIPGMKSGEYSTRYRLWYIQQEVIIPRTTTLEPVIREKP